MPGLASARLWAASRFPYLATGLFGAAVTARPGSGTVSVDERWRLRVDPELVSGWTAAEFGSVLVHHVCHLLRAHAQRAVQASVTPSVAPAWIRAADAEINDDLFDAGLALPGSPVRPEDFGAPSGRFAEEYYQRLQEAQAAADLFRRTPAPGAPPRAAPAGPVGPGGTEGPGGTGGPGAFSRGDGTWLDCGSGADGQRRDGAGDAGLDPWEADLLRRRVADEVSRAGQEPGKVPAGLRRWARELLSPRVDWRRVLAAELRRAMADTAGAADYSYRRPSRRAAAVPSVVLPALRRPVPGIAVVCDTSGSMSDELLAMALTEVEGLLRSLGLARQLRVLACDAAARPAQRVTSARQVTLTGGGGTNMGAGIWAAHALRPRPAVCVVLTDGHTPWPETAPKGMRVVAALLGSVAPGGGSPGAAPPEAPDWARSVRVPAD
ncbi:MAG TPA: VWA-like domain-containing protein [Trebonia sp.]|nr:VWA-like domain-containing protein [Trebonia sp.]